MNHKIDWRIIIAAILGITSMEIVALIMGYNGTLLKLAMVAVSILAGSLIPLDKIIKH